MCEFHKQERQIFDEYFAVAQTTHLLITEEG